MFQCCALSFSLTFFLFEFVALDSQYGSLKSRNEERKKKCLTNKWLVSESSKFKGDIFRVFDDIFNINFVQIKVSKPYIDRACHIYMHEIICPSLEKKGLTCKWKQFTGEWFSNFFFLVLFFIWSWNLSSLSNCHIAKVVIIIIVKTEQLNQKHTAPYIFIKW